MKNNKLSIGLIVALCIIVSIVISTIFINLFISKRPIKDTTSLYNQRTNYIGDASKSSKIAQTFNLEDGFLYKNTIIEKIDDNKNRLVIVYNNANDIKQLSNKNTQYFIKNSFIAFSLIQNLDEITIAAIKDDTNYNIQSIQRDFAIKILGYDPYNKTDTLDKFNNYKNSLEQIDYTKIKLPINNLSTAVSCAIEQHYKNQLLQGEFSTSAHISISIKNNNDTTSAYVYQQYVSFAFQNDIFEQCSSIVSPLKLTFKKDSYNNYHLLSIQPDGISQKSYKQVFSSDLISKVDIIKADKTRLNIMTDEITQKAEQYLLSINRAGSKISYAYQEKTYPSIEKENTKSYDILNKSYSDFPYYVGNLEKVENNIRYEYTTSYEKSEKTDIITYTKKEKNSDNVIENTKIQIIGGKINTLEGTLRDSYKKYENQQKNDEEVAKNYKN